MCAFTPEYLEAFRRVIIRTIRDDRRFVQHVWTSNMTNERYGRSVDDGELAQLEDLWDRS